MYFSESSVRARTFVHWTVASGKAGKPGRKRVPGTKPTHFLAVRLSQCEHVVGGVKDLQNRFVGKVPEIRHALTAAEKLHITLSMVKCAEGNEHAEDTSLKSVQELAQVVESMGPHLNKLVERHGEPEILLSHLSSFGSNVVFLGPDPAHPHTQMLHELALHIDTVLVANGFQTGSSKFEPHATILKLSKVKKRAIARTIKTSLGPILNDSDHMKDLVDENAAWKRTQKVESIELCAMLLPAAEDGFYKTLASCSFK